MCQSLLLLFFMDHSKRIIYRVLIFLLFNSRFTKLFGEIEPMLQRLLGNSTAFKDISNYLGMLFDLFSWFRGTAKNMFGKFP